VRIAEGTGKLLINGRELDNFFTEDKDRAANIGPLDLTEMRNKLDVYITINGGGITGQAGAACQGIARALKSMFGLPSGGEEANETVNAMAKKLRDSGFLTRDGRMKERKKYGLKGARKAFQFSKR
jgi:small subunit ribosomal protein S9